MKEINLNFAKIIPFHQLCTACDALLRFTCATLCVHNSFFKFIYELWSTVRSVKTLCRRSCWQLLDARTMQLKQNRHTRPTADPPQSEYARGVRTVSTLYLLHSYMRRCTEMALFFHDSQCGCFESVCVCLARVPACRERFCGSHQVRERVWRPSEYCISTNTPHLGITRCTRSWVQQSRRK